MAFAHERAGDRGLMGERLALRRRGLEPGAGGIAALRQLPDAGGPPRAGRGRRRRRAAPRARGPRAPRHARRASTSPARDWARAGQVAALLRAHEADPAATAMATSLDAARLARRGQPEEARRCSRRRRRGGGAGGDGRRSPASSRPPRRRRSGGGPPRRRGGARRRSGSLPARFLLAGLDAAEGRDAPRPRPLPALAAEAPALPEPHRALFRAARRPGDLAAADAALDAGHRRDRRRQRRPALPARRPARGRGDIAGAIADYETLYARSSDSPVLANNLASLLTTAPRATRRASSAPMPSPGGCAARRFRSSRTPTAGSSSCAATPPRR